jgi:hypothetical protein
MWSTGEQQLFHLPLNFGKWLVLTLREDNSESRSPRDRGGEAFQLKHHQTSNIMRTSRVYKQVCVKQVYQFFESVKRLSSRNRQSIHKRAA